MYGDKSWALPYFGGLKSPLASKGTLYNAWLAGQGQAAQPQVTTPSGALRQVLTTPSGELSPTPTLAEQAVQLLQQGTTGRTDDLYAYSPTGTGTGRISGNTGMDSEQGDGASLSNGMGLGKAGSMAASLGTSLLAGRGGIPIAGPLGKIAGMIADKGINQESIGNMAIGGLLGAAGAPGLLLAALNLAGFNPYQGLKESFGGYSGTPGYEGGFFGKQGLGEGVSGSLANQGETANMGTLANVAESSPLAGNEGLGIGIGTVTENAPGMGESLGGGLGGGLSYGSINTSPGSGFNTGSWGMGGGSYNSGDSGGGE